MDGRIAQKENPYNLKSGELPNSRVLGVELHEKLAWMDASLKKEDFYNLRSGEMH
jgi:hypothetical protein